MERDLNFTDNDNLRVATEEFMHEAELFEGLLERSNKMQKISSHDRDLIRLELLKVVIKSAKDFYYTMHECCRMYGTYITKETYNCYVRLIGDIRELDAPTANELLNTLEGSINMIDGLNASVFRLYNSFNEEGHTDKKTI